MNDRSSHRFNLIIEPLFQVSHVGKELYLSLPQVLELLSRDSPDTNFTHLRPHQHHSWFAFLVQLAAMALLAAEEEKPEQDAARWADLLLNLTDGDDSPWCLVTNDLSKPAFMQPPVPERKIDAKKWKRIYSPGTLDLLVTAKNHDVKAQLIHSAEVDHWCYALINLQTMGGFLGAGNYGIVRMNGGFASRPGVSFAVTADWGSRFLRDVLILVKEHNSLIGDPWPYPSKGGYRLLWMLPWDGKDSLELKQCDPFFIEVCRRIRMKLDEDDLTAFGISTKVARISSGEIHGVTGDPWTPVIKEERKALTITVAGFNYRLMNRLLFSGEFSFPLTWRRAGERGSMFLLASALTGGQGKTEGLHQRQLSIPQRVVSMLDTRKGTDRLGKLSNRQIERCNQVRSKVLHRALCTITQGAPEGKLDFRDKRTGPWLTVFDRSIDVVFFDRLFAQLDLDDESADCEWIRELVDLAEVQLDDALRTVPQSGLRRYRVSSAAKGMFYGMVRKNFPELFEEKNGTEVIIDKGAVHV